MDSVTLLGTVEPMLQSILADEPEYFLVEARIKPTNNIKIFLDGDNGITIEKCVKFNRALYRKIEEAGLFPSGDFSLELSSPGLDEPLKSARQYKKNIGRPVEVLLQDGTKKEGKLVDLTEDGIIVEESLGKKIHRYGTDKKPETINHTFLFNNIKSTKIQVVF
jgi:ribosome maturation factor RimP